MQRSTRFNRPTLRGSSIASLLFGKQESFVLKAGPDTTTSTSLTWTQPNYKPDNYRVERSTNGISFSTVATVSDSTLDYNDTGLTESTQYWYRIVPILGGADQPASNVADTWTVPSTPTTLTATAVGGTQIDLTWVDVSTGNTGQIIERRTPSGSGSYSLLATVGATATTYSDTGLTPGQSYEYRVAATNPATLSAYSNTASATPSATPTAAWTLDFSSGEPWANGTNYTFSSTASTSRTFVNSSGYVAPCVANLLLRSQDLLNAAWVKRGTGSVSATLASAPDGTVTANELSGINTGSNDVYQLVTTTGIASGTAISPSFWIQKVSSSGVVAFQNAATSANGSWTINLSLLGTGWERITSSHPAVTVSTAMTVAAGSQGAGMMWKAQSGGPLSFRVWGTQIAVGTDPLPYSATTTSSNGIPRLTHNSSGARLGLLVEGQRTNGIIQSEDFNTTWVNQGATVTTNATTAPDNTSTADRIVEDAGNANHARRQDVTRSNCVYSCYFKSDQRTAAGLRLWNGSTNWIAASYDLSAGTATAVSAGTGSTFSSTESGIANAGNGWYRCWIRFTVASAGIQHNVEILNSATPTRRTDNGAVDYAGNTANGLFAWGAQSENENSLPTSYIATTTASVTRSADLAHVLDSSITSWGDPGALVVHFYPPLNSGTLISTDDAATAQVGIEASTTTAARAFWSSGSTATGTIGSGVQKAVHYWNGSTSKFAINGGTVQSGTNNLTIANTDFVTLGAEATDSAGVPGTFSQYSNCIIRRVEFYSGTLTDAQLQAITT